MNSLPDQFSAARQTQLDNGFNLIRSFSDQALDRTSRVFALQLDASRATVEHSSNAMRQLLAARDPRDLLALGSQSQQHLRTMLDYGRELFSIAAAGMSVPMLGTYRVETPAANPPAALATAALQETGAVVAADAEAAAEAFERTGSDTASAAAAVSAAVGAGEPASEAAGEPAAAIASISAPATPVAPSPAAEAAASEAFERTGSDTASAEAATASVTAAQTASGADFILAGDSDAGETPLSVVTSDVEPDAERTQIAKATSEALDMPDAPPHPVAASVPAEVAVEIDVPKIEPVDAAPPAMAATTSTRPAVTRGTKGRRKQS